MSNDVTAMMPAWLRRTTVTVLCTFVLVPVVYVLMASVSPDLDVASGRMIPTALAWANYRHIWSTVDLRSALVNSVLTSGVVAAVSAGIGIVTAYCLVRFPFRGRRTVLRSMLGLQSVPSTLLLLPVFVVFSSAQNYLGIAVIGTRWGLILTYLTFSLPFSTWVLVTYLRQLPAELEEAALLDGCSRLGALRRVVLPLSVPGLVVAGVFAFLLGWNDVLFASVITRPWSRTAAVALQVFGSSQDGGALPLYGQLMASSVVCAVPVVALYLGFQRYLVGGLTTGGVK